MAICAKIEDLTQEAIVQEIIQTAQKEGITDLWILDKNFILDALQEKAERENQKPLTIEELRQMNGLPVWVQELSGIRDNTGWALVEVDDSGVYKGVPFVKCHVCTWNVITRGLHCYRHKPKEEQK